MTNSNECLGNWVILDLHKIKETNLIIIKARVLIWKNVSPKLRYWWDSKSKPYIEELKEKTKSSDELYIVSGINSPYLYIDIRELSTITSILRYCYSICINLENSESSFEKDFEKINELPKKYFYSVLIQNLDQFIDAKGFDMIDRKFKNILISSNKFQIKIINSRNSTEQTDEKKKFAVNKIGSQKVLIVEAEELKKALALENWD